MSQHRRLEVFTKLTIAEPLNWPMVMLLISFAVVFALQLAVPPFNRFAHAYLVMDTSAFLAKGRVWQAVTSIFLHGSVCHFVGNMIFLWFFGSLLSNAWRPREFLTFFFTCGIVSSLCFYVFNILRTSQPVRGLGASGAVLGVMIACAMIYGDRIVLAFLFIPMKIKHFVAFSVAIDILCVVGTVEDGVGHVAHLGGAICAAIYLKVMWRLQSGLAGVARGKAKASSRIGGLEVMDDDKR